MMRLIIRSGLLLAIVGASLLSCLSGDPDVGQAIIDPYELQTQYVDSITVKTYTVIEPDSFITSTDSSILIGQWADSQTGKLTAQGFTSVDFTANDLANESGARFDSLVIEFGYSFSYGDTTQPFTLQVYPLRQALTAGQTYYNYNSAGYEASVLAQKSFMAVGREADRQVRMRLPTDMGQAFFSKLVSKEINDTETMASYWKGLALIGEAANNVIWGINMGSEKTGLRLYYHTNDMAKTASSIRFSLGATHFTQLTNDASGSVLQALKYKADNLISTATGHITTVGVGVGFRTRIEFPWLSQFTKPEAFLGLNMAQLQINPIRKVLQDNAPPPDQLALYQTNSQNELVNTVPALADGSASAVASYAYLPNELELADMYVFDITKYVADIIKGQAINRPLLLAVPSSQVSLKTAIRRVMLGDQQHSTDRIKLRLIITSGT
jgi:hypothetical protein